MWRSNSGPEFPINVVMNWAATRTPPPGQSWRNGYVDSFNARRRDECLNVNCFYSLSHAQVIIGDWKQQYNHERIHSSLGYLVPLHTLKSAPHNRYNRFTYSVGLKTGHPTCTHTLDTASLRSDKLRWLRRDLVTRQTIRRRRPRSVVCFCLGQDTIRVKLGVSYWERAK